MAKQSIFMQVMVTYHFMAHFFFMKCKCVVSGHCPEIDQSVGPSSLVVVAVVVKVMTTVQVVTAPTIFVPISTMVSVSMSLVRPERCSFPRNPCRTSSIERFQVCATTQLESGREGGSNPVGRYLLSKSRTYYLVPLLL